MFKTILLIFILAVTSLASGTYRALLTQHGTAPPTAIVLENTLGGEPVFTRFNQGGYRACLANAFPGEEQIFGLRRPQIIAGGIGTTLRLLYVDWDDEFDPGSCLIISSCDLQMQTGQSACRDDRLILTPIEITVYPITNQKRQGVK